MEHNENFKNSEKIITHEDLYKKTNLIKEKKLEENPSWYVENQNREIVEDKPKHLILEKMEKRKFNSSRDRNFKPEIKILSPLDESESKSLSGQNFRQKFPNEISSQNKEDVGVVRNNFIQEDENKQNDNNESSVARMK